MTNVAAINVAGPGEPSFASLIVTGLKWAREAIRALKAVARKGQLMNEAAVRGIATRADASCPRG